MLGKLLSLPILNSLLLTSHKAQVHGNEAPVTTKHII
jgi:hypothetical protein